VEAPDGRVVIWDGSNVLQFLEPSSHIFAGCSGCHAMRWKSHGIGPDLMGIVGDRVARHDDFGYSEALREAGGRWTTERLDAFLKNPQKFAPGTSMAYAGIEDPQRRAEIIEYLAELRVQTP
jgi:cytochrome c